MDLKSHKDYDSMSAWQLLDVKIDFDREAAVLEAKIDDVVEIYEAKRAGDIEDDISTNVEGNELGL